MSAGSFVTFGAAHLITLGVIALVSASLVGIARWGSDQRIIAVIRYGLAILLVGNEAIYLFGAVAKGLWSPTWGLPFQICDLAILAVAYSLLRHNLFVWEIAYFWGLGGTMQALLTPDLQVSFPDYIFIKFFITHGAIVIGIIFLAAGLGRPIQFRSVQRVFVVTNLYAGFMALFNWKFGTNYLYLCEKPSQASLMDLMGPWPYYLIGLEAALIVSLFVYYMPYYFFRRSRGIEHLA